MTQNLVWWLRGRAQHSRIYCALYYISLRHYGSFVNHQAKFAGRPCLPHSFYGIFIAGGAKIGAGCTIFQHVTIGQNAMPFSRTTGVPTIGNNCYIGAGATIIGGVTIGHNCRIGANCTVTIDVPDNAVVVMPQPRIILKGEIGENRYYRWSEQGPLYFKDGDWLLETDPRVAESLRTAL